MLIYEKRDGLHEVFVLEAKWLFVPEGCNVGACILVNQVHKYITCGHRNYEYFKLNLRNMEGFFPRGVHREK